MSSELGHALGELVFDPGFISESDLSYTWMATNDARNYVIIGDPAVRLPVTDVQEPERPEIIRAPYHASIEPPSGEEPAEADPQIVPPSPETPTPVGPQAFVLSGTVTLQPAGGVTTPAQAYVTPGAELPSYGDIRIPFLSRREDEREEDQETRQSLLQAVKDMAQNAAQAAAKVAEKAAILEVVTYTSDDMTKVQKNNIDGTANLRAVTRIKVDGDIEVCVPQKEDGEIDQALWTVHSDMVQQAQANRTALIKTVVDAISWLVKV
jgi:hypothetical protein